MSNEMRNNIVEQAKNKLKIHRAMGDKSKLKLYEVAELMDVVAFGVVSNRLQQKMIPFQFLLN